MKKTADLNTILKNRIIEHIILDAYLANLVLHGSIRPIEFAGVRKLRNAVYGLIEFCQ